MATKLQKCTAKYFDRNQEPGDRDQFRALDGYTKAASLERQAEERLEKAKEATCQAIEEIAETFGPRPFDINGRVMKICVSKNDRLYFREVSVKGVNKNP